MGRFTIPFTPCPSSFFLHLEVDHPTVINISLFTGPRFHACRLCQRSCAITLSGLLNMLCLPPTILGAVVLTLFTTVKAAGPGFVHYDISRRQNTVQSTAVSSLANLLPIGAPLYTINITVGTPPQSMMVQLDTGSSDLEILATNICSLPQAVCNPNGPFYVNAGSYNVSASSTAQFVNNTMVQMYADTTQFVGSLYTDTVGVAGVSVQNMTVAVVQNASAPSNLPINGILGIGFAGGEAEVAFNGTPPYPTLLMTMNAQGLINSNTFSLYLNDPSTYIQQNVMIHCLHNIRRSIWLNPVWWY